MRKIKIGVSVTPPNVVHTTPFVAKALGLFAKHCIDAEILQFEGGGSPAARAAIAQGTAIANLSDIAIGHGMKAQQFWGFAPRLPQVYAVSPDIKTAADLKGRKLSASGGGVGGFQWRMGREVLQTAGLKVEDAQFISQGTAGRLPGLVTGQIDGVALHPEDMYLAMQKKPGVHALVDLSELMPKFVFNVYGASSDWIARDPCVAARRRRRHDRSQSLHLSRQGQGGPDHGRGTRRSRRRPSPTPGTSPPRTASGASTRASTASAPNGRSTTTSRSATSMPRTSRLSTRW